MLTATPPTSHRPQPQPQILFDLNIKLAGQALTLPVYQTDSDISLSQRLLARCPEIDPQQCREKVRAKVIESLRKLKGMYGVKPEMKARIGEFLIKCEIEVRICLDQRSVMENGSESYRGRERDSLATKIVKQISKQQPNPKQKEKKKKKKKKQFTKLYSIRKGIFNEPKEPQALEQQKQNMSRLIRKLSQSRNPNTSKNLSLQQESQILKRIQKKLTKYQTIHKLQPLQPQTQKQSILSIQNSIHNLTNITEPYNEPEHKELATSIHLRKEGQGKPAQRSRYRYNYEEIITERQLSERKLTAREMGERGQEKSKIHRGSFNYMSQEHIYPQNTDGLRYSYYRAPNPAYNNNTSVSKQKPRYQYLQQFNEQLPPQSSRRESSRLRNSMSVNNMSFQRSKYEPDKQIGEPGEGRKRFQYM